jgi:hypothetical protein
MKDTPYKTCKHIDGKYYPYGPTTRYDCSNFLKSSYRKRAFAFTDALNEAYNRGMNDKAEEIREVIGAKSLTGL